jgi:hypothetical protein
MNTLRPSFVSIVPLVLSGCLQAEPPGSSVAENLDDEARGASSIELGLVTGGVYQSTASNPVDQALATHGQQFFCEMESLGSRWLRLEVDWYGTSAQTYRAIVDGAHARNMKVIALVPGPTCASNGDNAAIDSYTKSYVAKLDALANQTFAGHLPDAWEILNEPNVEGCSSGARAGGNVFAWLLRRVWEWKKQNGRKELIISGAPLNSYLDETWYTDFFASGAWTGERPFDLMGIHPYNPYSFNKVERNFAHWANLTRTWLVELKQRADQRSGRNDTQLMVTEFGWEKCTGVACVASEEDVVIGMETAVRAFEQSGVVRAALWYDYRDDPWTHMGLRRGYDAALGRHPVKAPLWHQLAALSGGPAGAAEQCWGGGQAGSAIGLRRDAAYDQPVAECHARNGGPSAAGKPFDNGGTLFVHSWGNGVVQDFRGGPLGDNICMRKSGTATAFMVRGDIRKVYFQNGGGQGWLGYPIEDEHGEQRFEHGRIVWDAAKASFVAKP